LKAVPHGTRNPLPRNKKILFTSQEKQQTPIPIQTLQTIQTIIPMDYHSLPKKRVDIAIYPLKSNLLDLEVSLL
jgi:hypothetical protein